MTRLALMLALVTMSASSGPIVVFAQGGNGGVQVTVDVNVNVAATPRPVPVTTQAPSINRPSFPIGGLNRPSFPLSGPLGISPPTPSPFEAGDDFTRRVLDPRFFGVPFVPGFSVPVSGFGGPVSGFGVPLFADPNVRDARAAQRGEDVLIGILHVDATPRTAMVFIDGAYVGTVDDLLINGMRLTRGRHWLELEAPGYEKKLIEINITPGQPLRYRADLTPIRQAALAAIPPRAPETMYAIPGCYGGNRPPVAADLPRGCDIAKLRVLRPQQRAN